MKKLRQVLTGGSAANAARDAATPAAERGGARHNADYTKTARTMRAGRAERLNGTTAYNPPRYVERMATWQLTDR
ncbi:hypothetical protein CG436_09245 [Pantoea ananatis]|nr:hypothetical protein CG432_13080 [Pantoea ananatis]PQL07163.1 hypothetical protein CG436_09245 [Pantoea ananatis]